MKTLEELKKMDKAALKAYAYEDLAIELKGNLSEETLIERITERQDEIAREQEQLNNPVFKAEQAVSEPAPEPVKENKETKSRAKELEDALKSQIDRGLGFETDAVAWTMSYRGQVISGNLSVPEYIVVRQADILLNRK